MSTNGSTKAELKLAVVGSGGEYLAWTMGDQVTTCSV